MRHQRRDHGLRTLLAQRLVAHRVALPVGVSAHFNLGAGRCTLDRLGGLADDRLAAAGQRAEPVSKFTVVRFKAAVRSVAV
jgi:hypothetical protein